jgi:hypothetical protein
MRHLNESAITEVKRDLAVLKWMAGFNLAIAILFLVLPQMNSTNWTWTLFLVSAAFAAVVAFVVARPMN